MTDFFYFFRCGYIDILFILFILFKGMKKPETPVFTAFLLGVLILFIGSFDTIDSFIGR